LGLPTILTRKTFRFVSKKFSVGLSAGFLRDMPINDDRTIAIASGIGFSYNNYNENLFITTEDKKQFILLLTPKQFIIRKVQTIIDVPIEFRWRTSTYESHKFWRLYGGFKFSYLLYINLFLPMPTAK
jgi:hypothetical protein